MNRFYQISLCCLSLCLLFCVTCATFSAGAAELTAETSSGGTGISANVTAASKPEFTVTIPQGIQFDSLVRTANDDRKRSEFEVKVAGVEYLNGKTINVTLSAPNGGYYLYADGHALPYTTYLEGSTTDAEADSKTVAFTADGAAGGYVEVNQKDIRVTGTYSGSLVFTVSLED